MKKLILFVLIISMAFSCVFAFTACNEEEPLSKWDVRQFYGTYADGEYSGTSVYLSSDHENNNDISSSMDIEFIVGGAIETVNGKEYSSWENQFITQEIADLANQRINIFSNNVVIDESSIKIGNLSYTISSSKLFVDRDENNEIDDTWYRFVAENENAGQIKVNASYHEEKKVILIEYTEQRIFDGYTWYFKIVRAALEKQ